MATYKTNNTDFTGGLMSPHLRGRIDLDKFNKGLKQHENFIPSIQGPTRYREGFEWIRQEPTGNVKLIDFSINNENRYLLALSAGLINIYSRTGFLLYQRVDGEDDGFGNTVSIPYLDDQINDVRWSPEVETMIFTHPLHPPYSLTANSVFDTVQLFAVSGYTTTLGDVTIGGFTSLINGTFTANLDVDGNQNLVNTYPRWTLYDADTGLLEYWDIENDGAGNWNILVGADHPDLTLDDIYYTVPIPVVLGSLVNPADVPVTGWVVGAAGGGTTVPTVAEESAALQDTADPLVAGYDVSSDLYAGAAGAEGVTPWLWKQIEFTSHPFQKIDISDTIIRIEDEQEVIKLVSAGSEFGVAVTGEAAGGGLTSNAVYIEYKVGNQYGLGRALSTTTTPAAPADPTASTCFVEPVDKVVNINDPSVRVGFFDNNGGVDTENKPWLTADGVPEGDTHVRADTLIFRTSNIGAWIRIGGSKLFTNVVSNDAGSGGNNEFTAQDGDVRWCHISDYRGVEDHPVDFIYNTLDNDKFDSGSVYEVYQWDTNASITGLIGYDSSGQDRSDNDINFVVGPTGGTSRFTMDSKLYVSTDALAMTSATVDGSAPSVPYAGLIIANMSTQRQFDVVKVDTVYEENAASYPKLIAPTQTISSYDLVTDADGQAFHTATLRANLITFDAARDEGRFFLGALVNSWVLCRINGNSTLTFTAEVDVLTSIPRDEVTGDMINDGVFTKFRWGAWYENNYPNCVSFYEQRRVFAGTRNAPNLVWLSNLNDPSDFRTAEENGDVLDTTGITYQLGTQSTIIRWLTAGTTLIAGTESNEWQLRPNEFSAAITPSNIRITQETSIGSDIQGLRVGSSVFFPHISGKQLHEFKYDFQSQQFVISTVTKLVPDLFENDSIKTMAYQFQPNSVFWIVTENGNLYSLTYRKEDDFYAWAKHSSPTGTFKDVAVLPKGDDTRSEDQLWLVIERDGVNHLERLATQFVDDLTTTLLPDGRFLDSYVYTDVSAAPTTQVSIPPRVIQDGTTTIVVDGVVYELTGISEGSVTIPDGVTASSYTLVGLPYVGKLQLNPQAFDSGTSKNAYGQIKRIVSILPYLYKSMGYKIGFSEDNLETIAAKGGTSLYTGFTDEHNIIASQFDIDKTPIIVQDQPLPLTIVSAVIKTELQ